MSVFEYVMIPPAIVIGLAMTHVLGGAGRVVHRLVGHGPPIRTDWIHATWVAHIFVWMVLFWWYTYAWSDAPAWSLSLFIFLMAYAVAMYLLCAIMVPGDMEPVEDFADYFMSLRRWFFGGLIALILIDFLDTASKGLDHLLDLGVGYTSMRLFLMLGSVIAMRTERRAFHGAFAAVALVWTVAFFWIARPVIEGG